MTPSLPATSAIPVMPQRTLGRHGPQVSALGLGCMGMSDFYGAADDAQSLSVLHHALDTGVSLLDTADMYGVGANERLLAPLLRARRNEVVLATKFGNVRAPDGTLLRIDGSPACAPGLRSEPAAPGGGPHRPVLPAPS